MNLTYKEMKNQYQALQKTYEYIIAQKEEIKEFFKKHSPKSMTYIGCGSGFCLCQSGELTAKTRLGIPATALPAGDIMLNYSSYKEVLKGTMIITPSRSGSTSEVIKAIENIKLYMSGPVFAISCVKDSLLSKIADYVLELPWAYDESVCQTRSVTNLYTANLILVAILAGDTKLLENIQTAIKLGEDFMDKYEEPIKNAVSGNWINTVILADGEMQGIASEGAMAFTEIAQVHTNYYHLLDSRHGPMVLIDKDTLVVAALSSNGVKYQKDLISDIIKRGSTVITYADNSSEAIEGVSLHVCSEHGLDPAVCGIPFIFIIQIAALTKAKQKGLNPDDPSGLVAWVKL